MDKLIIAGGIIVGLGVTWFVVKAFWKAWTYAPFIDPDGEAEVRRSMRRTRRERRRLARSRERAARAYGVDEPTTDVAVENTGSDGFESRYGDWHGSPTGRLRESTPPIQDVPR